jgi:hypothetical protein
VATAKFKTILTMKGPFFDHDPAKTFMENVHVMMVAIKDEGAKDVQGQLRQGAGNRAPIRKLGDRVADHVGGELRRAPSGPGFSAVILVINRGMSKAEAISMMAAASFLEGSLHAFRKTQGRILRARAVNQANLTKGIE